MEMNNVMRVDFPPEERIEISCEHVKIHPDVRTIYTSFAVQEIGMYEMEHRGEKPAEEEIEDERFYITPDGELILHVPGFQLAFWIPPILWQGTYC